MGGALENRRKSRQTWRWWRDEKFSPHPGVCLLDTRAVKTGELAVGFISVVSRRVVGLEIQM